MHCAAHVLHSWSSQFCFQQSLERLTLLSIRNIWMVPVLCSSLFLNRLHLLVIPFDLTVFTSATATGSSPISASKTNRRPLNKASPTWLYLSHPRRMQAQKTRAPRTWDVEADSDVCESRAIGLVITAALLFLREKASPELQKSKISAKIIVSGYGERHTSQIKDPMHSAHETKARRMEELPHHIPANELYASHSEFSQLSQYRERDGLVHDDSGLNLLLVWQNERAGDGRNPAVFRW